MKRQTDIVDKTISRIRQVYEFDNNLDESVNEKAASTKYNKSNQVYSNKRSFTNIKILENLVDFLFSQNIHYLKTLIMN